MIYFYIPPAAFEFNITFKFEQVWAETLIVLSALNAVVLIVTLAPENLHVFDAYQQEGTGLNLALCP